MEKIPAVSSNTPHETEVNIEHESEESNNSSDSEGSLRDFIENDETESQVCSKSAALMTKDELEVVLGRRIAIEQVGKARFEASIKLLEARHGCS